MERIAEQKPHTRAAVHDFPLCQRFSDRNGWQTDMAIRSREKGRLHRKSDTGDRYTDARLKQWHRRRTEPVHFKSSTIRVYAKRCHLSLIFGQSPWTRSLRCTCGTTVADGQQWER